MSPDPKPRRGAQWNNGYEAQLSDADLFWLHSALLERKPSDKQIRLKLPPWREGPFKGQKVSLATLSNIRARLKAEEDFRDAEASTVTLVNQRREREPEISESDLEEYGQRVFTELTIVKQDLQGFMKLRSARNKGKLDRDKLDLKRKEVELSERRVTLLEKQVSKAKETLTDPTLSETDRKAKMYELFGISG